MARRKKKPQRKSPSVNDAPATAPAAAEGPPASRGRLKLALVAALVWIAALAALAFSTANRPMLNRTQIEQADLIVTAKIVDVQQGTVIVEKTWKPGSVDEPITVRDLSETKAHNGSTYILPVTFVSGETYEITRPNLRHERHTESEQQRPPRIYDATDEAIEQLREMLGG